MKQATAPRKRCLLVADDLTGASDAAAPFKLRGARSIVCLTPEFSLTAVYDVVSISTASRDLELPAMRQRMREAALRMTEFNPTIIFKKIDSTLRGNPGAEIAAALEAFGCECAVITPAFPQMGRVIRNGYLYVKGNGDWTPIDVAQRVRTPGADHCVHVACDAVPDALDRGHRFISVETNCDRDLQGLAAATLGLGRRVLYAGSAGLAAAIAEVSFGSEQQVTFHEASPLPCVFCIGSNHPVTRAQLAALAYQRSVECFSAGSTWQELLAECLLSGHHAIVTIPREVDCGVLRELLANAGRFAALLLSGGDTASLICGALGTETIELEGEIVTGLPWGRLRGGLLGGLPVATKSGGFGASNALIEVADFFTCHRN